MDATAPSISIALCTFNGARFLREQLASIAAQSRLPDEIVISDDGSTDQTTAILREFAEAAPFPVRIMSNDISLGTVENFAQAISASTGEIIVLSDQDDVWLPNKLQRIESAFFENPNVSLVFSNANVVDENLTPLGYSLWDVTFPTTFRRAFDRGKAVDVLLLFATVTGAAMAFRTSLRERFLPIPQLPYVQHDGWIALIASIASQITYIDEPLLLYRQHGGQQIGASQPIAAELPLVWHLPLDDRIDIERERLTTIFSHLKTHDTIPAFEKGARHVLGRLVHIEARSNLASARLKRIPSVIRELISLRYFRHSDGFRSALRDLFYR